MRFLRAWVWLSVITACRPVGPPATGQASRTQPSASFDRAGEPRWTGFGRDAFVRAQREHRLVLLSIQARFCHWCHVMNATTYRDPAVLALLDQHFVTMRIDEAENPALAARYAEYGWPATVILGPDAEAVIALRGHRPAPAFSALLGSLVDELARTGRVTRRDAAPPATQPDDDLARVRDKALAQLDRRYDAREGGWGTPQKYPFAAPVEHALYRAAVYDDRARREQAVASLHGYAKLIDPVAGGMYQYSLDGVYDHPHYEKLASIQAGAMRVFAEGFAEAHDPALREGALAIARYTLHALTSDSGAFYTSQDADSGHFGDANFVAGAQYYGRDQGGRAALPAPSVDHHVFANLNGMLIRGFVAVHQITHDPQWLAVATRAASAIRQSHARGAGFMHDAALPGGPLFLSDQVEMAAAMLALHAATGERIHRDRAYATLDFCIATFEDPKGRGFFAETVGAEAVGVFATREKSHDENALLARLLLARSRVLDEPADEEIALAALRALSSEAQVEEQGRKVGDYLLALESALTPYLMFTLVAPEGDARADALRRAVLDTFAPQGVLALHAPGEGPYPYPGRPALYLCSASACSSPVFAPERVAAALSEFVAANRE